MSKLLSGFGCGVLLAFALPASAQNWPTRPVTMVVPFAAGGAVDGLGRILAPRLGEILGQQVVVENVTGAGGMIGANRVAKAAPDGYQVVLGNIGTHAQNQSLYKRPMYNAATDFENVIVFSDLPLILVTRKDFPAANVQEFVAYAKANPDRLQYGSAGAGSAIHLGCVLLNASTGIQATHIPYRGGGPTMLDLVAGRIDYSCNIITSSVSQVKDGLVKALANLAPGRARLLPELPTAREQGLDFEASTWNILSFPKGTAPAIVNRLNAATNQALDTPATRERLQAIGLNVPPLERRRVDFAQTFIETEIARWAGPIRASGLSID